MLKVIRKLVGAKDAGRSELRRASEALATAKKEEAELVAKLGRLQAAVADAEAADAAFHKAVADLAEGVASDDAVADVVTKTQKASALAVAARAAAPSVQAKLDELVERIKSLERDKQTAVVDCLMERAKETYGQYDALLDALLREYDQIAGMRRALGFAAPPPVEGPRFDGVRPTMKHFARYNDVEKQSYARWAEARQRLDADPDADVDDLTTPAEDD